MAACVTTSTDLVPTRISRVFVAFPVTGEPPARRTLLRDSPDFPILYEKNKKARRAPSPSNRVSARVSRVIGVVSGLMGKPTPKAELAQ